MFVVFMFSLHTYSEQKFYANNLTYLLYINTNLNSQK